MTFSTRQRELATGRVFSTRHQSAAAPPARPGVTTPAAGASTAPPVSPAVAPTAVGHPPAPLAEQGYTFHLISQGGPVVSAFGAGAQGAVSLAGRPGGPWLVQGRLQGVRPVADPSVRPTLWLIHDLTVPHDLAPADLAALPRGTSGGGNQPGAVFTVDGNPATYGPNSNTVAVSVTPGAFTPAADSTWQVSAALDPQTNQAFHPLAVLGPSVLASSDTPVPSGTAARILTDLYMRPAIVHPELPLRTHFQQRLAAIANAALGAAPSYIDGAGFTRAAVTLEGLVRTIPRLMPTRETCFLAATTRTAS